MQNMMQVAVAENPFKRVEPTMVSFQGQTLRDILVASDIRPDQYLHVQITISSETASTIVPMSNWHKVRPKAGVHVRIEPIVHGAAIASLLSAVVASFAPTLVAAVFPNLVVGSFMFSVAVAAVSVVGALIIRAIIPPPKQLQQDPTNFNLAASSNQAQPYAPYPTVLGRRAMHPLKTATGYTETVQDEIYLRERMTFGYGPVALESLKIGTTDITEFEDVQIEFLNVDETRTLANIPGLAPLVKPRHWERTKPNFILNLSNNYEVTAASVIKQTKIVFSAGGTQAFGWSRGEDFGSTNYDIEIDVSVGGGAWALLDSFNVGAETTWTSPIFADGLTRKFRVRMTAINDLPPIPFPNTGLTISQVTSGYQAGFSTGGWRNGTEAMTIYSQDISEDPYNVLLEQGVPVVRTTRVNTQSASVDIGFQGLVRIKDEKKLDWTVDFDIEYRKVGDVTWITHETKTCTENTTAYVRFTSVIDFPEEAQWEIQITRTTDDTEVTSIRQNGHLTAIRSVQDGDLPSHENIAEIAIRIKASNELNGQLQNLNAVVQQLAPVWDGAAWGDPEPVRHPAWIYARALMGPMLRDPVPDTRIALDELKAWADDEPHWTCDQVITGESRLADILDLICACGRARRGLSDLKYSVIRDGGAGGIVQHFTPRNSWGFSARRFLDREIHALRCRVTSERLEWAQDEVIVYADGYNAQNATEIETLDLPGVVLTLADTDESNAWRLGRYHIAVAQLRPEEFTWNAELDHIPCQMGDKVRLVHDVPLIGVGFGRVKSVTLNGLSEMTAVLLDEIIETAPATTYRLRFRLSDGTDLAMSATHDGAGLWTLDTPSATVAAVDDMAMVEETTQQPFDVLITRIIPSGDLTAEITGLPAAPEVLDADTGTIPTYDPTISVPADLGPPLPTVNSIRSDRDTAILARDGVLAARVGVVINPALGASVGDTFYVLRWRHDSSSRWTVGEPVMFQSELFTGALEDTGVYHVEVAAKDARGNSRGWVSAGSTTATVGTAPTVAEPLSTSSVLEVNEVGIYNPVFTITLSSAEDAVEFELQRRISTGPDVWETVGFNEEGVFTVRNVGWVITYRARARDVFGFWGAFTADYTAALIPQEPAVVDYTFDDLTVEGSATIKHGGATKFYTASYGAVMNGRLVMLSGAAGEDNTRVVFTRNEGGAGDGWIGIPTWNSDGLYIFGPDGSGGAEEIMQYHNREWRFRAETTTVLTLQNDRIVADVPIKLPSYTVATVPSAAALGSRAMIWVSDETGGATQANSDGANWRRVRDNVIIS